MFNILFKNFNGDIVGQELVAPTLKVTAKSIIVLTELLGHQANEIRTHHFEEFYEQS